MIRSCCVRESSSGPVHGVTKKADFLEHQALGIAVPGSKVDAARMRIWSLLKRIGKVAPHV